jgi:hypothetical protein
MIEHAIAALDEALRKDGSNRPTRRNCLAGASG